MSKIFTFFKLNWKLSLCALVSRNMKGVTYFGSFDSDISSTSKIVNEDAMRAIIGLPIGPTAKSNDRTFLKFQPHSQFILHSNAVVGGGTSIFIDENGIFELGENSYLCSNTVIGVKNKVTIGSNCMLSWSLTIIEDDGHTYDQNVSSAPISIGDNVWVGCNVTILKGVTLGNNCVVAAGAVVTKSFPENSIIGGVPAKLIRMKS